MQLILSNYRLAAVHLVDAHLCSDAFKYISALLLSLNVMMSLELPHINVLSKMDLIEAYGELAFNLDYYTEVWKRVLLFTGFTDAYVPSSVEVWPFAAV